MALLQPRPAEARPERQTPRVAMLVQGLLIAIFFGLSTFRFIVAPLDRYDEGVTLTKAALAAAGRVPYRDFWATYGPLDTYLIAAAFKVFGINVTVERGMAAGLLMVIGITAYALIGYVGLRGAMRLLLTGLITVVPLSVPAFNSAFLANAIGLLALLAFFVSLEREQRRWPLMAGLLVGLSAFARPEFAMALGVGLSIGYAIPVLRRHAGPTAQLLPYLLGAALAASVLWLPMVVAAGIKPVWFDLVTYATDLYPKGRSIPFGRGDEGLVVIVFSVAFGLIWLWALVRAYRQRRDAGELARLLALLTAAVLIFTWVRTRADGIHAMDAWPLTATLLALLLQRRRRRARPAPLRMEAAVSLAGILLFSVGAGGLALRDLARPHAGAGLTRAGISGQRAWLPTPQLAEVLLAIEQATPDGRPIWIGLQRNDLVTFNDTMLYFLSGREPGTVYYETLPGLTNADGTERTIACQLERSRVTLAVLGPNGAPEPWNLSSVAGSGFLDQWLESRTVGRSMLGAYELLRLRPGPDPGGRCSSSGAS